MQVNVSQLLQEPIGSRRHYSFDEDFAEGGHASCTANLMRTDVGVVVTADCEVDQSLTCGRCLNPFTRTVKFRFDEEFFPLVDVETGADLTPPEEDSFTIDGHHVLDMTAAVQQYAILEQPLLALCRPDCQGLCPQCGTNLNEAQCSCPPPVAHPAWEKLRELWAEKENA